MGGPNREDEALPRGDAHDHAEACRSGRGPGGDPADVRRQYDDDSRQRRRQEWWGSYRRRQQHRRSARWRQQHRRSARWRQQHRWSARWRQQHRWSAGWWSYRWRQDRGGQNGRHPASFAVRPRGGRGLHHGPGPDHRPAESAGNSRKSFRSGLRGDHEAGQGVGRGGRPGQAPGAGVQTGPCLEPARGRGAESGLPFDPGPGAGHRSRTAADKHADRFGLEREDDGGGTPYRAVGREGCGPHARVPDLHARARAAHQDTPDAPENACPGRQEPARRDDRRPGRRTYPVHHRHRPSDGVRPDRQDHQDAGQAGRLQGRRGPGDPVEAGGL